MIRKAVPLHLHMHHAEQPARMVRTLLAQPPEVMPVGVKRNRSVAGRVAWLFMVVRLSGTKVRRSRG